MQKLFRIIMLMLATALVACGGGGGSSGANPNQPSLFTTAPASIFLAIGASQEYTITGGIPPYNVVNGDKNIAIGGVRGNSLTIGATSAGQTTVAILDNIGSKVTINVKAGADFVTSAPGSVTVGIGTLAAQTFGLSGGAAPYTAVSGDTGVATVTVSETRLTITGLVPGFTEIIARDATGFERKISVIVQSAAQLFTTANGSVDISLGAVGARTFTIGGGTAPYTASSGNTGFVSAVVNGNSLFVTGNAIGSTIVKVRDSAGATVLISISVSSVTPLFTTADGSISLFPGAAGARNFTIGGGTAPYSASSSNAGIVSASVNGNNLVITGLVVSPNSVNVTVRDEAGGTVVIPVTVANVVPFYVNAPSTVTIGIGAALAPTYEIGGGSAPYTAVSDNTAVATVSVNQTSLVIQGVYPGNAVVQVRDSQGAIVVLKIVVTADPQGLALYTTAPASLSIGVGAAAQRNFYIGGGVKPYTVEGNNNSVAIVQKIGEDQWTVTGVAIGVATVKIRDAAGKEVSVALDVNSPALRISPDKITMPISFTGIARISGGQKPYSVISGIPAAISATIVNGDELHIVGLLPSVLDISVADVAGQIVKIEVTINAANPGIRLSPSAVSVSEEDVKYLKFTLFGAAKGEVCFFSSNPSIIKPIDILVTSGAILTCMTSKDPSLGISFGVKLEKGCVTSDATAFITAIDSERSVGSSQITILDTIKVSTSDCPLP